MAAPFQLDNVPDVVARCEGAYFEENGAGVYTHDFFIPAGVLIENIIGHAEVLWAAATSAVMEIGDYAAIRNDNGDMFEISTAIDADGFFTAVDLKATDLLAGESIDFMKGGGQEGAYLAGTATHWVERFSLVDRWVRVKITSVGAGTAGRTAVLMRTSRPAWVTVTQ